MNVMQVACVLLTLVCTLNFDCPYLHSQERRAVTHVTIPMSVEGNVPIVTMSFKRPNGTLRTARFVFDSGGGAIIFNEGLAADLGLRPEGTTLFSDGQQYQRVWLWHSKVAHFGSLFWPTLG
jgi:hypothetical protein